MTIYDVDYTTTDFNNCQQIGTMVGVKAVCEFDARMETEKQVAKREYVKFCRANEAFKRAI